LVAPAAPQTPFAAFAPRGSPQPGSALCGRALAPRGAGAAGAAAATAAAAVAPARWLDPRQWGAAPPPSERLSPREWTRLYRSIGLEMDAPKDRVARTVSRLRKKYADDEQALERVENANLWITTKILAQQEEAVRKRQQANRIRELGDSPRRLFMKYIAGYLPPSVRQLFEVPTTKHLRLASALMGGFALIGLCVPTQASNFVGLSAAATMGLIYQRGRPEPVKDEFGNVGRVQKINYKEAGATVVVGLLGVVIGLGITAGLCAVSDAPFEGIFCLSTCSVLWALSLFLKVYGCFDPED